MENFSGQLKKYKDTANDLLEENQELEARARASESGKMKDTMERAKLESAESKGGRKEKEHMTKSAVSHMIPPLLL